MLHSTSQILNVEYTTRPRATTIRFDDTKEDNFYNYLPKKIKNKRIKDVKKINKLKKRKKNELWKIFINMFVLTEDAPKYEQVSDHTPRSIYLDYVDNDLLQSYRFKWPSIKIGQARVHGSKNNKSINEVSFA